MKGKPTKRQVGRSVGAEVARCWAILDSISGALADAGDVVVPTDPKDYAAAIRELTAKRNAEVKELRSKVAALEAEMRAKCFNCAGQSLEDLSNVGEKVGARVRQAKRALYLLADALAGIGVKP
jgi:hypothetical protein